MTVQEARTWIRDAVGVWDAYDTTIVLDEAITLLRKVLDSGNAEQFNQALFRVVGCRVCIYIGMECSVYFTESELETLEAEMMQRKLESA